MSIINIKPRQLINSLSRAQRHIMVYVGLMTVMVLFSITSNAVDRVIEPQSLTLYHYDTKRRLTSLTQPLDYQVLKQQGEWHIVQFSEPGLPVWVHSDYVSFNRNDNITVNTNRLNARAAPMLGASVVMMVVKGYNSDVIQRQMPFIQIYAPTDLKVAILAKESQDQSTKLASEWRYEGASQQSPTVQPTNVANIEKHSQNKLVEQTNPMLVVDKQTVGDVSATKLELTHHNLSPGDVISLNVFGEPDLSVSKVRIPESGVISLPLIGGLNVAKKTVSQVESQVKQQLERGYIKNPRLSITIDAYRPIFVKGAVISSGSFPYTEGLTVAKALALAGGLKKSAKSQGVSIFREDKEVVSDVSVNSQYVIQSGDIISVDDEPGLGEETGLYVYLHGEVKTPGAYQYRKGLTVEKAVVLAGGFSLRASKRKISVSRVIEDQEKPQKMKRVKLYLPVQPGDIIDVGASLF